MSRPIIEVDNISKCYKLGSIGATRLRDDAERLWNRVIGKAPKIDAAEFWALRGVSFHVQPGEVVGIVGRNGAGKSTLLKILSRITEPTSGEVVLRGRVASLLEVGTGFHADLTGRENIFLNGAILGMSKKEIRSKIGEIIAFAEIEKFVDTPVKRYSSGMYVRLAFAVAAHLEPEILIIDEVLAVGDSEFQKKCVGKMQDVSKGGRTVLFVSHQLGVVSALCPTSILLDRGAVTCSGATRDVLSNYIKLSERQVREQVWPDSTAPGTDRVKLRAVRVRSGGELASEILISTPVRIEIDFENFCEGLQLNCSFQLLDNLGNCILATGNMPSATLGNDRWGSQPHAAGCYRAVCELPIQFLNDNTYSISAYVVCNSNVVEAYAPECISFRAHDDGAMRQEYTGRWPGMIRPRLPWISEKIS
jgi:lipopolysaccharide transport system ATP-binding protein